MDSDQNVYISVYIHRDTIFIILSAPSISTPRMRLTNYARITHLVSMRDDSLVVSQHAIVDNPEVVHGKGMAERKRGVEIALEAWCN